MRHLLLIADKARLRNIHAGFQIKMETSAKLVIPAKAGI
jgi:hypothetical protein